MGERFSEWVYGWLLALYPKRFRREFAEQMQQTFRDARRSTYQRGGSGALLTLWLLTLFDLFASALRERSQNKELVMSRERLRRWAGPLTAFIGAMWVIASFGELMIFLDARNGETFWDFFWMPWVVLSLALLPVAVVATWRRFQHAIGLPGVAGLGISLASSVGILLWIVVSAFSFGSVSPGEWFLTVSDLTVAGMALGYLLFGIDLMRGNADVRWKWLPVVAAAAALLHFAPDLLGAGKYGAVRLGFYALHYAVTGVCLLLFGVAMSNRDAHHTTPEPRIGLGAIS